MGLLTGLVVSNSITALFCQPSRAESNSFFCGTFNTQPVTFDRTPRGNISMMHWVSNNYFPPPWTAQRRYYVLVYRNAQEPERLLKSNDSLDGEEIVPDFTLPIANLFQKLTF